MYRFLPPPVILVLIAIAMWLTGLYPEWTVAAMPGQTPVAALIAGAGLLVIVWATLCFRRARTTINPTEPDKVSALVETGPYRCSRNPMYLGNVLLLIAWAVYLGVPVNILWVALFAGWMDRLQIPPEERALAATFGEAWASYRGRVRRWI